MENISYLQRKKKEFTTLGIDAGDILIAGPRDAFLYDVVHSFALVRGIHGAPFHVSNMGIKYYDRHDVDLMSGSVGEVSTWRAIVENGLDASLNEDGEEDNALRYVLGLKNPVKTAVFDYLYSVYPDTKMDDMLWKCERLEAAKWALAHGADRDYGGLRIPLKDYLANSSAVEADKIFRYAYGVDRKVYQEKLNRKEG